MKKRSSGRSHAPEKPPHPERLLVIDLLKGLAIIAVILNHSWSVDILLAIGAPFHIYHSVPLLILIAGFTGAYTYLHYEYTTIGQCYNTKLLFRRFRRILLPYILMFMLQIAILSFFFHHSYDIWSILSNFLTGGYGIGSYFVPVIVQSILIVPILYLIALRNPNIMLILAFFIDIFMESLSYTSMIPMQVYLVLYSRFLFAGALGVWLALSVKRQTIWIAAAGIFSGVYLSITYYTQLFSVFFRTNIGGVVSQAPGYFWTYMLALMGVRYFPTKAEGWFSRVLENIGKASWHIFLVQMTFFAIWEPFGNNVLFPIYLLFPPVIDFVGILIIAFVTISICAGTGYLWYRCESSWTNL